MTKIKLWDNTIRLHFGGYLVCHLVDFRFRISADTATSLEWNAKQLKGILLDLISNNNIDEQRTLLSKSDNILSNLDTLLLRMTPNKVKDFLMTFYENADLYLENGDHNIRTFLEILCDENNSIWEKARGVVHDLRLELTKIGGILFSIDSYLDNSIQAPPIGLISERKNDLKYLLKPLDILFNGQEFVLEFRKDSSVILKAYLGTDFHKKAEDLIIAIIRQIIENSYPAKGDELNSFLKAFRSSPWMQNEAHVAPLIRELREILSWEEVETLMINDPIVLKLKYSLQAISSK